MLHRASHISFLTLLMLTIHFLLFTIPANSFTPPSIPAIPLPSNNETENSVEEKPLIEPPPSVKLNIRPPQNEEEAFKRIKDYKVLINIIPPGTSKEQVKKQLFGEYKDLIEPYLEEEKEEESNRDNSPDYRGRKNKELKKDFYHSKESYTQNLEEEKLSKAVEHKHKFKFPDYPKEKKANLENKPRKTMKLNPNIQQEEKEEKSSLPILPIISFVIISAIAILFLTILRTFGGKK